MASLKGLLERAYAEEGYIEKASNSQLDSKTANRGDANYTKYARDINALGLMGCQAQAWCCTFQFWLEVAEYGVQKALEHWCMTPKTYVGYNCFATYNAFAKKKRVGKTPKMGAIVIFTFSHAGRVIAIDYTKAMFACIEGNTSSNLSDRNGGMVKIKWRSFYDSTIKGFCYIDYDAEEQAQKPTQNGWIQENDKWRYYHVADDSYLTNVWHQDASGQWSYFDSNGYALCNQWLDYKGHWYYFDGACYMKASRWVEWKGCWYYLTADGTMAVNCYVHSQQPNCNMYYYLNHYGEYDSSKDKAQNQLDYTKDQIAI